jgi:hypothetical protein
MGRYTMSTGKVTDVSVEHCASNFRVSSPRRRFSFVFSHPNRECIIEEERGKKQNLMILTACSCDLSIQYWLTHFVTRMYRLVTVRVAHN